MKTTVVKKTGASSTWTRIQSLQHVFELRNVLEVCLVWVQFKHSKTDGEFIDTTLKHDGISIVCQLLWLVIDHWLLNTGYWYWSPVNHWPILLFRPMVRCPIVHSLPAPRPPVRPPFFRLGPMGSIGPIASHGTVNSAPWAPQGHGTTVMAGAIRWAV